MWPGAGLRGAAAPGEVAWQAASRPRRAERGAEEMATCSSCGAVDLVDGARFCHECGAPTAAQCSTCGEAVVPGVKFCSSCGAPQAAGAVAAPARAQPVAERRVTSVLFGDLVGFTTAVREPRPGGGAASCCRATSRSAAQVVARYGGTVEKFIGDAVMAVWGVPTAHEDDAERAVRAGLELVATVVEPRRGRRRARTWRCGSASSPARSRSPSAPSSRAWSPATRSTPPPGCSRVAAPGPGVGRRDHPAADLRRRSRTPTSGSHALKGKAEPVPLWAARAVVAAVGGAPAGRRPRGAARRPGPRAAAGQGAVPRASRRPRRPRLLVVDGEPGVGKSRLGWEFEKYVDGLSDAVRWHRGRCLSYGEGVAFWALAEAVRGRLGLVEPDGDEDRTTSRAARRAGWPRACPTRTSGPGSRRGSPRCSASASVGTFAREDLFAAWTTFFERVGDGDEPVVLLIDDAQHADDGLLDFLDHLLDGRDFPCFVRRCWPGPSCSSAGPTLGDQPARDACCT